MAETTHVWIAQCLCPQRHCICAIAGEAVDVSDAQRAILAQLQEQVADLIAKRLFNPWCGLCHAPASEWKYEVQVSDGRLFHPEIEGLRSRGETGVAPGRATPATPWSHVQTNYLDGLSATPSRPRAGGSRQPFALVTPFMDGTNAPPRSHPGPRAHGYHATAAGKALKRHRANRCRFALGRPAP